jgi:hypothetical protein
MFEALPISQEAWRYAQYLYEHHPEVKVAEIAVGIGASHAPVTGPSAAPECGGPPDAAGLGETVDLRLAADALGRAALGRINAILAEQANGRFHTHDRIARTLASLASTLKVAQQFKGEGGSARDDDEHEADARTLDELRTELGSHLDRIVAEERAAGGDGILVEAKPS